MHLVSEVPALRHCSCFPFRTTAFFPIYGHNKVSSVGIPKGQIAEALGKRLASDTFESYSAETVIKEQINQDAVRLMKQLYHIDMEQTQYNKLLSDIPSADIVITMGVMWTVRACHAGTRKTGDCMIRPAWTIPFLRIPYC